MNKLMRFFIFIIATQLVFAILWNFNPPVLVLLLLGCFLGSVGLYVLGTIDV